MAAVPEECACEVEHVDRRGVSHGAHARSFFWLKNHDLLQSHTACYVAVPCTRARNSIVP